MSTQGSVRIRIGRDTVYPGTTPLTAHKPVITTIGNDCLIAVATHVMASDMHSVVDQAAGRRLNPAGNITIAARVWIGFCFVVFRGTRTGECAVIGAGAVVANDIAASFGAGGNPARIIRKDVIWDPTLPAMGPEQF